MHRFIAVAVLIAFTAAASIAQAPRTTLRVPYHVVVGTTAVQLTSSSSVTGVLVKAISPGQTIYLGVNNTVSELNGFPLADGDWVNPEILNADQVWAIADSTNQRLAVWPYRR